MNALQWMAAVSAASTVKDLGDLFGQLLRSKDLADQLCGQDMVAQAVEKAFERLDRPTMQPRTTSSSHRPDKPRHERKPRVFRIQPPCGWHSTQKRVEALKNALEKAGQPDFLEQRSLKRSIVDKTRAAQSVAACDKGHKSCIALDALLDEIVASIEKGEWNEDFAKRADALLNPPEPPPAPEPKLRTEKKERKPKPEPTAAPPASNNGTQKVAATAGDAKKQMPF